MGFRIFFVSNDRIPVLVKESGLHKEVGVYLDTIKSKDMTNIIHHLIRTFILYQKI